MYLHHTEYSVCAHAKLGTEESKERKREVSFMHAIDSTDSKLLGLFVNESLVVTLHALGYYH